MTRILTLVVSLGILFTSGVGAASAGSSLSCKKRNPWVYNSWYWVQILPSGSEEKLLYGTGIDSQMMEIHYQSGVHPGANGDWVANENEPNSLHFYPAKKGLYRLELSAKGASKPSFISDGYSCTQSLD